MNPSDTVLYGRNAVLEGLRAEIKLDVIYLNKTSAERGFSKICALALQAGIPLKRTDRKKLDALAGCDHHQGVVAILAAAPYSTVQDMFARAKNNQHPPMLVIADGIQDPHNLGAIIRSAEAAGADGLIFAKNRSASLAPILAKTSAGAVHHLPIARVTNLTAQIKQLKKMGIWVYGAAMQGEHWCQVDYSGGVALVLGSEGQGLHQLVSRECDRLISLPMCGQVNSLNASVAGGILLYEIARQRLGLPAFTPPAKQ